jgi:hypothetical protein
MSKKRGEELYQHQILAFQPDQRHPLGMDDIEAVIEASKHFRFNENNPKGALNRISNLPESKARIKRAIKERIRMLTASYISLASFVPDEDADYVAGLHGEQNETRLLRIFRKVLKETNKLEKEMKNFDPFDLPIL